MANYTTPDDVIDEVGIDDIPTNVQAKIPNWIAAESQVIDAALPNYEVPFADVSATPSTPGLIQKACRFLVLDRVLRKLAMIRTDDNGRVVESYKHEGERILRQLRDGEAVIPAGQLA